MQDTIAKLPPFILLAAYAVFWSWEAIGAARERESDPRRRWSNLAISIIGIVISALTGAGVLALSAWVETRGFGAVAYLSLPMWGGAIVGIVLLDLTDYWRHRVSHRWRWLWRLHRVHHTDRTIDVTSSLRNHPFEMLLRPAFAALAVALFGIGPLALLLQPLVQLPILIFQHANIRLPAALDRTLAWVFVTPRMHLVHHSRTRDETDSNYATLLTAWDRLFGTFRSAEPEALGLEDCGESHARSFVAMLAEPWTKRE